MGLGTVLPELWGEPDENSFRAPDIAEPMRAFELDHFADELRAAFASRASVSSMSSTVNMTRR